MLLTTLSPKNPVFGATRYIRLKLATWMSLLTCSGIIIFLGKKNSILEVPGDNINFIGYFIKIQFSEIGVVFKLLSKLMNFHSNLLNKGKCLL